MRFVLVTVLCLLIPVDAVAADDPELKRKKTEHEVNVREAKQKLDAAFGERIDAANKKRGAKLEDQVKVIDAIKKERETFAKSNMIPFSPVMREDAIRYLDATNRSTVVLAKEYDRQIQSSRKGGQLDLAKELANEKQKLIVIVGVWDCAGTNFPGGFTWVLYSDFSVNRSADANDALPKGWSFQPNGGLLIKNFAPGAPKGGFSDRCQVSWDGQLFEAKNQLGGVYTARLRSDFGRPK